MQPDNGVQLHVEILELDVTNEDELIDRFAINITNPIGSTSEGQTYSGVFELAEINITFGPECAKNFYGPNCDMFCPKNCAFDDVVDDDADDPTTININTTAKSTTDVIVVPLTVAILSLIILAVMTAVVIAIVSIYYRRRSKALEPSQVVRYSQEDSGNPVVTIPGNLEHSSSRWSNITSVSICHVHTRLIFMRKVFNKCVF